MSPESKSPTGFPTDSINDWVFDLDNTIYPARSNLFVRVAVRITEFVARHFDVPHDEAKVIQKDLFHRYGTTMRGLMVEQGLTPEEYLHFVHDIDVSDLPVETELDAMLAPSHQLVYGVNHFETGELTYLSREVVDAHQGDIVDWVAKLFAEELRGSMARIAANAPAA